MPVTRTPPDPGFGRIAVLRAYPRDPLAVLSEAFRRSGDVASFMLGPQRMWAVHDPGLIGQVLTSRATAFHRGRLMHAARALLGDGLLTSEEPLHQRQRRLVQPSLTRERTSLLASPLADMAEAHAARWPRGLAFDAVPALRRVALDAVAGVLFGGTLGDAEAERVATALTDATPLFRVLSLPLAGHLLHTPLPFARRFRRARHDIDTVVLRLIADRRASSEAGDDLLSALLHASDVDGGMSDAQLRDEAVTLFLAGHETTANALAWSVYLLARSPDAQERLANEARSVLGDGPIDPAHAERLTYCGQVIAEALRLYPPAWILLRRAVTSVELGPYRVGAGDAVVTALPLLHRHPAIWHEPDRFDPERFDPRGTPLPRYAYLPFGAGPRACIGRRLALLEARIALATIARRFRVRPANTAAVPADLRFTLRPGAPINIVLEERSA